MVVQGGEGGVSDERVASVRERVETATDRSLVKRCLVYTVRILGARTKAFHGPRFQAAPETIIRMGCVKFRFHRSFRGFEGVKARAASQRRWHT